MSNLWNERVNALSLLLNPQNNLMHQDHGILSAPKKKIKKPSTDESSKNSPNEDSAKDKPNE